MYHLATIFPKLKEIKLPLSRDQLVLVMVAINEIIVGVDIFLAHSISRTIVPYEWIPIIFGPIAGILLLISGAIAIRRRELATSIATLVFVSSILVGVLGSYFHIRRAFLLDAGFAQMFSIDLAIWAPPLFGPITFAGLGIYGLSAAFIEAPAGSGKLKLWGNKTLQMPFSKTRGYLFLVALGMLAMLVSSVFDHARTGFENPWLWLPTVVGIFAVVVAVVLGVADEINENDVKTYFVAMTLMMLTGLIGTALHIQTDLTSDFQFVQERFLRGAPFMAPLNFVNMGMLSLIVLLDPKEETE
ncbi:MAG: hypothetical protein HOF10_07765 [Chloroflexi bacterium]|nr:hypothetical protein [Chloroflexota bacterium]